MCYFATLKQVGIYGVIWLFELPSDEDEQKPAIVHMFGGEISVLHAFRR